MQPAEERKAWCEPDAADAVLSGAVKIDNFSWIDLRLPGNLLEIESELRLVTNRNLDQPRALVSLLATPGARERFVYFLCERLNDVIDPGCIVRHAKRIKKNCDRRVSGREFDHARNTRVLNPPERAENLIRGLFRRVLELIANPHDERGISERRNLHRASDLVRAKMLIFPPPFFRMRHLWPPNFEAKRLQQHLPRAL